ncbi:hypothetical protein BDD12DRAFT_806621 [Trichophaea hybrida]|nr:hypothetical protein BDD12DRAFT_806621 [Trichophaea hybrida]
MENPTPDPIDSPPPSFTTDMIPNNDLWMRQIGATRLASCSANTCALEVASNSWCRPKLELSSFVVSPLIIPKVEDDDEYLGRPKIELSNSSNSILSPFVREKIEEDSEYLDAGFCEDVLELGEVPMFDYPMATTQEDNTSIHQDQQEVLKAPNNFWWYKKQRQAKKKQTSTNSLPLRWNRLTGEVCDLGTDLKQGEEDERPVIPPFHPESETQQFVANLIPRKALQLPSTPKSGMTPLPPPTKQKARTRKKKRKRAATAPPTESPLSQEHCHRHRERRERSRSPYRHNHHYLRQKFIHDHREWSTQRRRRLRIDIYRPEPRYSPSTVQTHRDQVYTGPIDSDWVPAGLSSMALGPSQQTAPDPYPTPSTSSYELQSFGKDLAAELLGSKVLYHISKIYAAGLRAWLGETARVPVDVKVFRAYIGALAEANRGEDGLAESVGIGGSGGGGGGLGDVQYLVTYLISGLASMKMREFT